MQEIVNDPYALKRLQMECEELKESLKLEKEKYSIACGLMNHFITSNKKIEEISKDIDNLRNRASEVMNENTVLKDENRNLKEQLQESSHLESVIMDYEEKMFILTGGQDWKKAVTQKVLKNHRLSAEILCYAIQGCIAKEISRRLSEDGGISITARRVNSVLSVKEDKDLLRIRAVFHQFPDIFCEHDISEEDLIKWFSETGIKC